VLPHTEIFGPFPPTDLTGAIHCVDRHPSNARQSVDANDTAVKGNTMKMLPMEQIRILTPEEFRTMVKEGVAIERKALKATETHKLSFPAMGKLVCRAEEDMNLLKSDRDENNQPKKRQLPVNTTLAEYWRMYVVQDKDAKVNPHWLSCAVTFGTYVRMELISEADYDKNTAECLELAASISTAAGHDVSHDAIVKAAAELKDRSKDSRKKLQAILEDVRGKKALTAEKAKEHLIAILAANPTFLVDIVIPTIGAEIAHVENPEIAKSAFFGLETALSMFASNVNETGQRRFPDELMDSWINAKEQANAPVQFLAAGQPVGEVAAAA
jgi:hypothetical protein